jgi:hypothetical protein
MQNLWVHFCSHVQCDRMSYLTRPTCELDLSARGGVICGTYSWCIFVLTCNVIVCAV